MVLVNGASGIGTGWSTSIPNFAPKDIVANIRRMLAGEEPRDMTPWYMGFKGDILPLDNSRFVVRSLFASSSLPPPSLPF